MTQAWPAMMLRATAAAYLDMSEAEFARGVSAHKLPRAKRFIDKERWSKADLDAAIAGDGGAEERRARSNLYADADHREAQTAVQVYSPRALAERWRCSRQHIRSMIHRGELMAFRYGREFRITSAEVEWIEAMPEPKLTTSLNGWSLLEPPLPT